MALVLKDRVKETTTTTGTGTYTLAGRLLVLKRSVLLAIATRLSIAALTALTLR